LIKYKLTWKDNLPVSVSEFLDYVRNAEPLTDNSVFLGHDIYVRYFEGQSSEHVRIGYFVNAKDCSDSSCKRTVKFKRELILIREKSSPYRTHLAMIPQYEGELAEILGYQHDRIRHKLVKVERSAVRRLLEEAVQNGFLSVAVDR